MQEIQSGHSKDCLSSSSSVYSIVTFTFTCHTSISGYLTLFHARFPFSREWRHERCDIKYQRKI